MIPNWDTSGLIPPIKPDEPGHSKKRSPYHIDDLWEFVQRFSFSHDRCKILLGFFKYRHELHKLGITQGVHWLDGSFMEDIELIENRSPNDLDVFTCFYLPKNVTQNELLEPNIELFCNNDYLKETFLVDGYYMPLDGSLEMWHANYIAYWYSLWSHTREGKWKGFIEIDLFSKDDEDIIHFLEDKLFERREK